MGLSQQRHVVWMCVFWTVRLCLGTVEAFAVPQRNIDVTHSSATHRAPLAAAIVWIATAIPPAALAATTIVDSIDTTTNNYELASLPPMWVPAVFGVALLAGVGFLTSSLGNVLDEESSLGLQSGARAKKELDRSRSSYFKKK